MLLRLNLWDVCFLKLDASYDGDASWDLRKAPYKTSVLKQNIKIILNLWNLHPEDARNFIGTGLGVSFKISHRILSPILNRQFDPTTQII